MVQDYNVAIPPQLMLIISFSLLESLHSLYVPFYRLRPLLSKIRGYFVIPRYALGIHLAVYSELTPDIA